MTLTLLGSDHGRPCDGLYAPDVRIQHVAAPLTGATLYIGDGATITRADLCIERQKA